MNRWTVILDKKSEKSLRKLPKEVLKILGQLKIDLEEQGPNPRGWTVKHVRGKTETYSARLKREYRVIYEVMSPTIIIVNVAHRKEAY